MKTIPPSPQRSHGNFFLFLHRCLGSKSDESPVKTSRATEILCVAAFVFVLAAMGLLFYTHHTAAW